MPMQIRPNDVLLVIDVQNDFCPGGALAVPDGDAVVAVCNRLAAKLPHVILTQDWHPAGHKSFASANPEAANAGYHVVEAGYGTQVLWPDHCVQGTPGAQFHPALATDRAELVLRKGHNPAIDSYSAFQENDRVTSTGLAGYLRERGLGRLFLAGLATDFCVQWSALDGRREGFEVWVVRDGVRGIDLDGTLDNAWDAMARAGVKFVESHELGV